MFSVIIPTLWKPSFFFDTLKKLNSIEIIDEIIIISNAPNPHTVFPAKVKLLQMSENTGVNPAWNLGKNIARNEDLLILNDDITLDFDRFLSEVEKYKGSYSMISINHNETDTVVQNITTRSQGFGCCFYINKNNYVDIPTDLIIFFGDDWLFFSCLERGLKIALLPGFQTNGLLSLSSKPFEDPKVGGAFILTELYKYMNSMDDYYTHKYKFSIIIPYYYESASVDTVNNLLKSLKQQSFKDFEVILIHDGINPHKHQLVLDYPYDITYICTDDRYDDWGHSLRDIGIKKAKGQYLMFLNCDNMIYSNCLEELEDKITTPSKILPDYGDFKWDSKDIIIYPILLKGQTPNGITVLRDETLVDEVDCILTGYPVKVDCIDCMQLVMKRARWDYYGGWYDKAFAADGNMYPRFVQENFGAVYTRDILGEHR